MEIKILPLGSIAANCYMIKSENAAVVIDPGTYSPSVEAFLKNNADKQRLILLTHCHFDHVGGAELLRENTGVKIAIGKDENAYLSDTKINLSARFKAKIAPFSADILLSDGEKFNIGDIEFTAVKTSGHTLGGMCYLTENKLFCGDTLFFESIGRTDFPGGSFTELEASIRRIYGLDGATEVYSGHGQPTTVEHERKYNPYVRVK